MKKKIIFVLLFMFMSLATECAKIIFINGVSSVGKTSVVKELQNILDEPYLHISMDIFMSLMPPTFIELNDFKNGGVYFEQIEKNNEKMVAISFGKYGERLLRALPGVVKSLADAGNNVIIELTLAPQDLTPYFVSALYEHIVFFIGLTAPIDIVKKREQKRSDRIEGLALGQYEMVHKNKFYDLFIDTSLMTPQEMAFLINNTFKANSFPQCFQKNGKDRNIIKGINYE